MSKVDYVLKSDTPGVHWPGELPYRGPSTKPGRGYASEEEALTRMRRVVSHYSARYGKQGHSFSVVRRGEAA